MFWFVMCILGAINGFLWSSSTIDSNRLDSINSVCLKNGGFDIAKVSFIRTDVYCKDGAKFRIKY